MGSEWKHSKLRDVGVQLIDCVHKTPPAVANGLPYIGIPQMKSGCIDFSANPRLISKEHLQEWSVKAKPTQDDIILSRRCNPGETVYVPEGVEFALGQNLVLLRASGETVSPPFLRWLVRGPEWWAEIGKYLNAGAVFDSLRCADIPNFELSIPPLPEQKAIAHILGSLDDKIELNRRMNETLEGMAQALFKSWFVDFDPVLDNALAAGNPIPEELAQRAEVRRKALADGTANREAAKQFPAAFQLTEEMGWIPEGWEVSMIDKEYNVVMGQSPKGDTYNEVGEGTLFYQGRAEFGWRFPTPRLYTTEPKRMAKAGDALMSVRAPVGDFNMALNDCCVGRGLCSLRHKLGSSSFTYYQMKDFKKHLDKFNSEGTVFGSINQKDLKGQKCLAPAGVAVEAFVEIVENMDAKILGNSNQIFALTQLRDTLLPKLISGELQIEDAVKIVEEL